MVPYWYLISRVFNFAFFAKLKTREKKFSRNLIPIQKIQTVAKGWKKAGISEVIDGKELPPEDPFEDL